MIFTLPPIQQDQPIHIKVGNYGGPFTTIQVLPSDTIQIVRNKIKQVIDIGSKTLYNKGNHYFAQIIPHSFFGVVLFKCSFTKFKSP